MIVSNLHRIPRALTRQVFVGPVAVGGGAPVSVQSMTTTDTANAAQTLEQIRVLADAGCEIIRVAVPTKHVLDGFKQICANSPLPVVADIHFDYRLALAATAAGAAALRINPGNIGSFVKVDAIIDEAQSAHIPIRIGVNAGSLAREFDTRQDMTLPQKLAASALSFVQHFAEKGFEDVVVSAKAHDVVTTIQTYRQLSRELPCVPLHIGITEAGTKFQGTIKSAVGLGALLEEGIGDTMRVSLTADPADEIKVAWEIMASLGMRRRNPELVSCPTCGRTKVNLIPIAEEVQQRLQKIKVPISVAVMGCAVNGPGEARTADIGVACGVGQGVVFVKGQTLRRVPEDQIIDALFEEIDKRFVADTKRLDADKISDA
ncbi:flavodoxin-dependent (E)-4-hydroxy-3-methylbut-2-enyl-diphosphate synthase [Atopobium deltae]|uniref:4-hydroxy-3-methylbut-2-en-1-yl diphosphate synthase (flavodoxin) n=1 Tax=Atopobium deltae TaxID=1393034 RepID=A0A133XX15_9ACTN|nr:flavodoxin-dependent (E)-4-hydroxy-3-methylbut-2-enyl-diphosphate synthase [Atopobium deltae]KXB35467.1 4-hydroxy-3-methylbut-2-en-1-yl diphosphate synthase [Atopobium deltae]